MNGRGSQTPDLAAIVVTAGLLLTVGFGVHGFFRIMLALLFVTFVPGWAILGHVHLADGLPRLALAAALSLTVWCACTLVALWLRMWRPFLLLDVVAFASLVALSFQMLGNAFARSSPRQDVGVR